MRRTSKLTNLQLELLKIFSFDLSDEQLQEIKVLLSKHFADKITAEMGNLFDSNGWGEEQIEQWSKEHMRTEYKDK